jgi:hypothetical protein
VKTPIYHFNTVVLGGGPAATGLLFNSLRKKNIHRFLESGVAFIESGNDFCCGNIGKFVIPSSSSASTFLDCLKTLPPEMISEGRMKKLTRLIERKTNGAVSLEWVGDLYRLLGKELKAMVEAYPNSKVFTNTRALEARMENEKGFSVLIRTAEGEMTVTCEQLVFAMGGAQNKEGILNTFLKNEIQLRTFEEKIIHTDLLFTRKGAGILKEKLSACSNPKAVVIGSSHSAFSALKILIDSGLFTAKECITQMHRSFPKIFYPSAKDAIDDQYSDFNDDSICPLTGRVHRLAGLRLESRELFRKMLGKTSEKEERIRMLALKEETHTDEIKYLLQQADVIIPALGYKPRTIPLYDCTGKKIELSAESGGSLVNRNCELLDLKGKAVPRVYGIGLASGFVPSGNLGGEPGFYGQTNGLWLYQNGVGEIILDRLMENMHEAPEMIEADNEIKETCGDLVFQ